MNLHEFQGKDLFGGKIEPILINSSLVSAQSRQRYYWTNIPNVEQPGDLGIVLRDILEDDSQADLVGNNGREAFKENIEKGTALLARDWKGWNTYGMTGVQTTPKHVGIASDINGHDILKRVYSPDGKSPTLNAGGGGNREPKVATNKTNQINPSKKASGRQPYIQERVFHKDGKSHALTESFADRTNVGEHNELTWRKLTPLECERLQTVPDNYTDHVSKTQRYKMLGNGWTINVISHILGNMETCLLYTSPSPRD